MTGSSQRFLDAITLTEVGEDSFTATTQYVPWAKSYGGDLVAQAAACASRTSLPDRSLHSMHGYFMRPAEIGAEVTYQVERLRDGRSYSTREVRGSQNGKVVFIAIASFQVPAPGDSYAEPLRLDLPDPESLPSSSEILSGVDTPAAEYWSSGRSFDMRHVPGPVYLSVDGERLPHQAVWIRAFDPLPDDPSVHSAALAYVCDYTILEPLLRHRGIPWADPRLTTASLDHSMWFHRPGRLDDWVVYVQDAISAESERGLVRGSFYDRSGRLLASVAQEGMIRIAEPS